MIINQKISGIGLKIGLKMSDVLVELFYGPSLAGFRLDPHDIIRIYKTINSEDFMSYGYGSFEQLLQDQYPDIVRLLFIPDNFILRTSREWEILRENKRGFIKQQLLYNELYKLESSISQLQNSPTDEIIWKLQKSVLIIMDIKQILDLLDYGEYFYPIRFPDNRFFDYIKNKELDQLFSIITTLDYALNQYEIPGMFSNKFSTEASMALIQVRNGLI